MKQANVCLFSFMIRCLYTYSIQEKYEEAMASLTQMENRAVMAETMLEATIQYQSSQQKAQLPSPSPSPRYYCSDLV